MYQSNLGILNVVLQNHGIVRLEVNSGDLPVQPFSKAGPPRASYAGMCLGGFGMSPERGTPQPSGQPVPVL